MAKKDAPFESNSVNAAHAHPCSDVRRNYIGWRLLVEEARSTKKGSKLRKAVKSVAKRCKVSLTLDGARRKRRR